MAIADIAAIARKDQHFAGLADVVEVFDDQQQTAGGPKHDDEEGED
jgi:hypothetical protein